MYYFYLKTSFTLKSWNVQSIEKLTKNNYKKMYYLKNGAELWKQQVLTIAQ